MIRTTGYYGVPGRIGGAVHFVEGDKPICGQKFHPDAVYLKCAPGWYKSYVECQKCLRKWRIIKLKEAEAVIENTPDPRLTHRKNKRSRQLSYRHPHGQEKDSP